MKYKSLICLSALLFSATHGWSASAPIQLSTKINQLYAPVGFDDNDLSEVVVTGFFPDSCYQAGEATFNIDQENKIIRINLSSYKVERDICIAMDAPFMKSIKLGHLTAGTYTVMALGQPEFNTKLTVNPSQTTAQDDFLYLPVEFADLINLENGKQTLYITGRLPKVKQGCMKIDKAIIKIFNDNMVIVQPIAKISEESTCAQGQPGVYHQVFDMPAPFSNHGLLHVRSLNGASYNRIVYPK